MELKTLRGCLSSPPLVLVVLMMTATSLAKAQGMKLDPADAACPGGVCPGLGNAFYLPNLNVLSNNTGGKKLFKNTTLEKCATFHRGIRTNSRSLNTLKSMNEFVTKVSTQLSLSGTFASNRMSVRSSASSTTGKESSHASAFHSATLDVSQVFATVDFNDNPKCRGVGNLSPDFLRAFEALPLINPENAAGAASWAAYVQFLREGSHVMTQQQIGSRFQRWESSTSEESNIDSKLRARACAEVEGVGSGKNSKPGWSAAGCAEYSRDEKASASRMDTHSERVIRGGSDETRNGLMKKVSPKTLNAFIDSGRLGNQAIGYAFTPIWSLLNRVYSEQCSKSDPGSSACQNVQRSQNLQAAYEGWLAIQCRPETANNVTYQEMRTTEPDERGIYSYQCWARKTGCADNGDCRIGGALAANCYCYGPTCFDTGDPINGTKESRTTVRGTQSGNYRQGVNQSCNYRPGATCRCNQTWRGGLPDRALYLQLSN